LELASIAFIALFFPLILENDAISSVIIVTVVTEGLLFIIGLLLLQSFETIVFLDFPLDYSTLCDCFCVRSGYSPEQYSIQESLLLLLPPLSDGFLFDLLLAGMLVSSASVSPPLHSNEDVR
jgi:hypothetical protein